MSCEDNNEGIFESRSSRSPEWFLLKSRDTFKPLLTTSNTYVKCASWTFKNKTSANIILPPTLIVTLPLMRATDLEIYCIRLHSYQNHGCCTVIRPLVSLCTRTWSAQLHTHSKQSITWCSIYGSKSLEVGQVTSRVWALMNKEKFLTFLLWKNTGLTIIY